MIQSDHYALMVTINRYPGLCDLAGPDNDGRAMQQWLVDPNGGGLLQKHVKHISSADFEVAANPDDANPTERELVRALNHWLRIPGGWKERIGGRIYLYFAGHGFTSGSSVSDPALFTAIAQIGDTAHIAGYRYAAKIVNAGFFDEVVLVMDCCQDVLKASQVLEPTWSPPDRNSSANVKFLQAYGAPRGRKAFEDKMATHGSIRGLFSTVWMDALTSAEADTDGWVSGRAVKNRLLKLWGEQYRQKTNYDPPVRLPDGEDILLYRRLPPTLLRAQPDVLATAPDMLTRGIGIGVNIDFGVDINRVMADIILETAQMRNVPMLAANTGTHNARLKRPKPVLVKFDTADPDLDIVILDSYGAKIAANIGTLNVKLMPGDYIALVSVPGASKSTKVTVERKPRHITLEGPRFASAAPLKFTSTTRESQQKSALLYSCYVPYNYSPKVDGGELFLFVRDSGRKSTLPFMITPALRLVGLGHSYNNDLHDAWLVQTNDLFALTKLALVEGNYGLVLDLGHGQEGAIALSIVRGWRTDVYLDFTSDEMEVRVPDLQRATFFMTPIGVKSPLRSFEGRATEVARLRFQNGRSVATLAGAMAPLHALFAAYDAAGGPKPDTIRIRTSLDMIPVEVRATLPDALLLEAFCAHLAGEELDRDLYTCPIIPMIGAGWDLMKHMGYFGAGMTSAVDAIGQWRVAGSVWTCWQQPRITAYLIQRRLRQHRYVNWHQSRGLEPIWSLAAWTAVASGLRKPSMMHSPFQQALRRRILDCIADECTEDPLPTLAAAFGLPRSIAVRSYTKLFVSARRLASKCLNSAAVL